MNKRIKLSAIFLAIFIILSSQSLAADRILPLPKPLVDVETKSIVLKKKRILPQKKPEVEIDQTQDSIDIDYAETNKEINLVIDPKTKKEFHPGVCIAVYNFFKKPVSACNGFWGMRKTINGWQTIDINF